AVEVPALADMELIQQMARRQQHQVDFSRIPGVEKDAPASWTVSQHVDHIRYLVDAKTIGTGPSAPLSTVASSAATPFGGEILIVDDPTFELVPIDLVAGRFAIRLERPI